MKKLLNSPKFWAITFGIVIGCAAYYILGDGEGLSNAFPVIVVSAYSTVAVVDKVKDVANAVTINKETNKQDGEYQKQHSYRRKRSTYSNRDFRG